MAAYWTGKKRPDIASKFRGRTVSAEWRERLSTSHKGQHSSPRTQFKRGCIPWNKGKRLGPRPRSRVSLVCKNCDTLFYVQPYRRGATFCSRKCQNRLLNKQRSGPNCHLWRGGVTESNKALRNSARYKEWRIAVFRRDDFTCQACKARGVPLQADHDLPFALFPDLRFEILNGRTLCKPCHRRTPTYGDLRASKALHYL